MDYYIVKIMVVVSFQREYIVLLDILLDRCPSNMNTMNICEQLVLQIKICSFACDFTLTFAKNKKHN